MRPARAIVAVWALLAIASVAQQPLPNHFVVNSPVPATSGGFGSMIAGIGDLDLDGFEDYAVAAPDYDAGSGAVGRVYVYSGRSSALLQTFDGDQISSGFGTTLAGVGDVNGDGVLDVLVGAPAWDHPTVGNNAGRVQCFSGATAALLWTAEGDQINSNFGRAISVVGSGSPFVASGVVVGQPGYATPTASGAGRVVYLSPTSGLVTDIEDGVLAFDGMGKTLAGRTSYPAIYAGSAGGRVYELAGPGSMSVPTEIVAPLAGTNDAPFLAIVLSSTPGASGLAIGRPLADSGGTFNHGRVEFLSLNALTPTTLTSGTLTGEQVGLRLTSLRDLDGDGQEEIGFASAPPTGIADLRIRAITTAGTPILDTVSQGGSTAVLSSIADVTGDGRGELLEANASGLSQRFDALLFADGLAESSLSTLPNGALHYVFDVDLGTPQAGATYLQLYSATNFAPGFVYAPGAPIVPIFPDALTDLVLMLAGGVLYPDAVGFLNGAGMAQTNAFVEPVVATMFSGSSFYTAVCVIDVPNSTILATSNPLLVTLP